MKFIFTSDTSKEALENPVIDEEASQIKENSWILNLTQGNVCLSYSCNIMYILYILRFLKILKSAYFFVGSISS